MRQILKRIVETLVVIFGNCIYAFGIAMFILPSGLITGGTTGIALFVNDVFHTPGHRVWYLYLIPLCF